MGFGLHRVRSDHWPGPRVRLRRPGRALRSSGRLGNWDRSRCLVFAPALEQSNSSPVTHMNSKLQTPNPTMHSNNNINNLSPAARSIVADYAKRRGIAPPQLDDFLNPPLALDRCNLPDAKKVLARLNRAAANREKLLLFGDYDCDGISSTAILLRFLGQRTSLTPAFAFALPDRRFDHYGLDLEKAKSLFCKFRPSLLNCLDCGTNSAEAVTWLKAHGVDRSE